MKKVVSVAVFAFSASIAPGMWASEIVVDRYGRIDFGSAPIASDDAVFVDSGAGSVTKSGTGVWTLPFANVLGFSLGGFELGLRSGTLKFAEGTAPDCVTTPPAVLQDAAVWLTAEKNTAPDAYGNVAGWYDARENAAASVNYPYAAKHESVSDGNGVKTETFMDKPAISFAGYVNTLNKSLSLKTPAGAASTTAMCDGFFVMGLDGNNSFAPVLANSSTGYFFTNPGRGTVLSADGNALWQSYQCTFRHNGVVADPTVALALNSLHVCEFTTPAHYSIPIDSIFRDRALASGGRYLHEFILFTRRLTTLERAQVTAYLIQKWGVSTDARLAVDVAEGAEVQADQEVLDKIDLSGKAVVSTTPDPAAQMYMTHNYARRDLCVDYRLSTAGERLVTEGADYALKLADGDAVTVDDTSDYVRTVRNSANGRSGEVTVDGGKRVFVVDQVPATKFTATVASGEVVLQAPKTGASKYKPGESVSTMPAATTLAIPAGTGGATTTVTIPTAGDWEVEFDLANECTFQPASGSGWTDGRTTSYYVTLTDDKGAVIFKKIALTVKPSEIGGVVPHRRYLLRDLPAGNYTFKAYGYQGSTVAATLSNLSFAFVPQIARETVVPVVGGDFETMTMNKAFFASRDNNGYAAWNLSNGGRKVNPCVQTVVNSMMGIAVTTTGYDFEFRSHECGRYGDNALLWIHTNAVDSTAGFVAMRNTASTKNATTLPAGTWRLRMRACRMTTGSTEFTLAVAKEPASNLARCGKFPAVYSAAVQVDGGAPIDLGQTDPIVDFTERTYVFPNAFTVAEGASVTINLDQLVGWSYSLTDDYEFVRVDEADDAEVGDLGPELIVNGSFETQGATSEDLANWTRDEYTDAAGAKHGARRLQPIQSPYGKTNCDGGWCVRSFSGGRASQELTLEEGVYRLSFWSRARFDFSNAGGALSYPCKLHFWYTGTGSGVTNAIVDTDTLWCSNFIQRTALFRVKTAGSYALGFNCDYRSSTDSLTDCVSVRKVLGAPTAPAVDPDAEIVVKSSDAATRLRLDYTGTVTLKALRVKGKRFYGEVTADQYPDYFTGPGTVNVTGEPRGAILIFR